MANKSISGLTASAANLASTDVAPVVQTTGVGPVKMTGLQLAGGLLGAASFNGATVTTSQPVLNLSQTWNAGAVTFTGLRFNATDTASASGSLLLDLQVGGTSKVSIAKDGTLSTVNGSSTGSFYSDGSNVIFTNNRNAANCGFYWFATNNTGTILGIRSGGSIGTDRFIVTTTTAQIGSGQSFGFSSVAGAGSAADTLISRDAANTLALRNGAGQPQTLRVYNTYSSAADNEYLTLDWSTSANVATIGTVANGTGTVRTLQIKSNYQMNLYSAAGGSMFFFTNGTARWYFDGAAGHFLANADNTYDIGASGANRPRSVYAGTGVYAGGIYGTTIVQLTANAGYFDIGGDTRLYRYAASVVRVAGSSSTAGGTLLHNGYTFSTLPTGAAGMVAYISDASNAAPAFGDTVSAGGGTTKVLCWYNGTNWTVIGK